MNNLNQNILRDFAKSERANRICEKWADRTPKQFRILDFQVLRSWNRAKWHWNDALMWHEQDKYKAHCRQLSDKELRAITA